MSWYEMVFSAKGWDDEDVIDIEIAQAAHGKKIVEMSLEYPGYWNIKLEDGTELPAIHTMHIIPSDRP